MKYSEKKVKAMATVLKNLTKEFPAEDGKQPPPQDR